MSLNALVYRNRDTLNIDVESLGAVRDDRTGEYYFPTPEHDGKFPREAFIAHEFWIGNALGVAELANELRTITKKNHSLIQQKVLYSGTHSGDIIELELLANLEREVRELFDQHRKELSEFVVGFLKGMLELIATGKRENNPIVFV
jgi:hypothetical protein